jgi:SAM-dependent methyltransferase
MSDLDRILASLPAEYTVEELISMFPDGDAVDVNSPLGRRRRRTIQNGLMHLVLREIAGALRRGSRGRRATDVVDDYEAGYQVCALNAANSYNKPGRCALFRLGDSAVATIDGRQFLRAMTERLGDILERLRPQDLCEVGAGSGRNLIYMAARFPATKCTGYELTRNGVAIANALSTLDDLPTTGYGKFYHINPAGMENVRRAYFVQASAFKLPAANQSHDVVYTFAALEQMQLGVDAALAELRRITKRYVLLFEPFADYNDRLGRTYLWARNYFRMRLDELPRHGFEIVRTWRLVPVKPTFAYSFALLKPR